MRRLFVALVVLAGCDKPAPSVPPEPLDCEPLQLLAGGPLSLERAREEHRWAELRRHLRMEEALAPGFLLRETATVAEREDVTCRELAQIGRLVFEHELTFEDGLKRPFRRVQLGDNGGPETNGCRSCHWRGGPAGAGSVLDNSFVLGDGDRIGSADARNPPPLLGVGLVELLAAEMTVDLQAQVAAASPGPISLESKGVSFGTITKDGGGDLDMSGLEGVDADLVVKPFGWKGNVATVAEFVRASAFDHFGTTVGNGPLTEGHLTALVMHLSALPLPGVVLPVAPRDLETLAKPLPDPTAFEYADEWADGLLLFDEVGCSHCHRRTLVLKDPTLVVGRVALSLAEDVSLVTWDEAAGGYPVQLFSDLKRHDLGDELASQHPDRGVTTSQYLTRRLWGVSGSGPFLHDGRAPFFDHALDAHGGEAAFARAAFQALDAEQKGRLRIYLQSLRRPWVVTVP